MSNKKEAGGTQSCNVLTDVMQQCTVVIVGSNASSGSLQSKKDQAAPILYLNRI